MKHRHTPSKSGKAFDEKASDAQIGGEVEVTKLQAKIGQLVVERDFLTWHSIAESGSEDNDDGSIPITTGLKCDPTNAS